jgi:hypothetical protein
MKFTCQNRHAIVGRGTHGRGVSGPPRQVKALTRRPGVRAPARRRRVARGVHTIRPVSLASRIADVDALARRFPCERPTPLVCVHTIGAARWQRLRLAALLYLSKCLPGSPVVLDEAEVLAALSEHRDAVPNITPNGLVVPKRHTILEFNALARAFADVAAELDLADLVTAWHVPMNLRIKFPAVDATNRGRPHQTELPHSDAWVGTASDSVLVHVPLFGDLERNHLAFYEPPAEFAEGWLAPLATYAEGQEYTRRYRRLGPLGRAGQMVLADFAVLHESARLPDAGPRISIDTGFRLRRAPLADAPAMTASREREYAAPEVLGRLGERWLLVFPDGPEDRVENLGGGRHPSNWKLVELL